METHSPFDDMSVIRSVDGTLTVIQNYFIFIKIPVGSNPNSNIPVDYYKVVWDFACSLQGVVVARFHTHNFSMGLECLFEQLNNYMAKGN